MSSSVYHCLVGNVSVATTTEFSPQLHEDSRNITNYLRKLLGVVRSLINAFSTLIKDKICLFSSLNYLSKRKFSLIPVVK